MGMHLQAAGHYKNALHAYHRGADREAGRHMDRGKSQGQLARSATRSLGSIRSLVRELLGLREDEEDGPIGPSPLERVRARGEPVDFKSDIAKIKSLAGTMASRVQASPAYRIGTAAWSGGLVGAAKAAGVDVPRVLSKPGEFLTRPEVVTAMGTVIPGAGVGAAAKGVLGAATKGVGSEIGSQAAGMAGTTSPRYVPKLDPVASYSTPTALITAPLSGKDPFKK
jgi:hypothetical protein